MIARYLLLFTISLFSIVTLSETTKNKCFIKHHISGENIIELNSNVTIYASDPTNGWCKTRIFILIDKAFIRNDETILEGAFIKDYYRRSPIIGKIIKKLTPSEIFSREDGNYEAIIDGYISYENIDIKSIPERSLEKFLSTNISSLDPKLVAFIKEFDIIKSKDIAGYHYYEIYDLIPEEAQIRIGLFFDKKNLLVAIMNNRRLINYQFVKNIELERNYRFYFLQQDVSAKLPEKLNVAIRISE